LNRSG